MKNKNCIESSYDTIDFAYNTFEKLKDKLYFNVNKCIEDGYKVPDFIASKHYIEWINIESDANFGETIQMDEEVFRKLTFAEFLKIYYANRSIVTKLKQGYHKYNKQTLKDWEQLKS